MTRINHVFARSVATKQSRSTLQLVIEIAPFWIGLVDEIDLLPPRTCLYLFLACDGAGSVISRLVINELGDVVAVGKSRQQLLSMLKNTPFKITGDARIYDGITLISQNVDAVDLSHTSSCLIVIARGAATKQSRGPRDCFAALAMTAIAQQTRPISPPRRGGARRGQVRCSGSGRGCPCRSGRRGPRRRGCSWCWC
jgi:hypothetical protein